MEGSMADNLELWNKLKQPPPTALKAITGGRLKGMTDVNPQWRYQALTEEFGPCGVGWKYRVVKTWNEPGSDGQIFAFADIQLFVKIDGKWSSPIPGHGGSMLVANEKSGPHSSDEGYKMAITDALSVACKMIGIAADIYAGMWDGIQYREEPKYINLDQQTILNDLVKETDTNIEKFLQAAKASAIDKIYTDQYDRLEKLLIRKKESMQQPGE